MKAKLHAVAVPGTKGHFHPVAWTTLLDDHRRRWQREDSISYAAAMWEVVEVFTRQGWGDLIDPEWPLGAAELADRQERCAQKVRRWLSGECQPPGPSFLLELERVMVAAMPTTIAVSYLNAKYGHANVLVTAAPHAGGEPACITTLAANMARECGEGISAALNLPPRPTRDQLLQAERELREAQASIQATLEQIGGANG